MRKSTRLSVLTHCKFIFLFRYYEDLSALIQTSIDNQELKGKKLVLNGKDSVSFLDINNMINNILELRMLINQLKRQLMSNLIVTNFLKSFRSIIQKKQQMKQTKFKIGYALKTVKMFYYPFNPKYKTNRHLNFKIISIRYLLDRALIVFPNKILEKHFLIEAALKYKLVEMLTMYF